MIEERVKFALSTLFKSDYFSKSAQSYSLREDSNSGKTLLRLNTGTADTICVKNFDKKPRCNIFLSDNFGMQKCIDHFVLRKKDNFWELHMLEMKKTVHFNEWDNIKAQFRSAYWNICSLILFLGINLEWDKIFLYVVYGDLDTSLKIKQHPRIGEYISNPQNEWDNNQLRIELLPNNIDPKFTMKFTLRKIQLSFSQVNNRLEGEYTLP